MKLRRTLIGLSIWALAAGLFTAAWQTVRLTRAVAAGEIRDDISPDDVLRALIGMCYMHDQPGWQATVLRLLDVFVDGLRIQPRARAIFTAAKPSKPAKKRAPKRTLRR